jgi:hypothetical protein
MNFKLTFDQSLVLLSNVKISLMQRTVAQVFTTTKAKLLIFKSFKNTILKAWLHERHHQACLEMTKSLWYARFRSKPTQKKNFSLISQSSS